MSKADNIYMLIRRRYSPDKESYEYKSIGGPSSYDKINKLALRKKGAYRDLYIMCDAARVSNIKDESTEMYVVHENGLARRATFTLIPWIKLWEGNDSIATDMIRLAANNGVDVLRTTEAVLSCIFTVLRFIPNTESSILRIFSQLKNFSIGKSDSDDVMKHRRTISDIIERSKTMSVSYYYISYAVANAIWMLKLSEKGITVDAGHAGNCLQYVMRCLKSEGLLLSSDLPGIVRKAIPLDTLLLAMTKDDNTQEGT